jgi:hypothetical protein
MPNQKISQLTSTSTTLQPTLQDNDQLPLARSGNNTYSILGSNISTPILNSAQSTMLTKVNSLSARDTDTIDLSFNSASYALSADVKDGSITNAKLAFNGGAFCFRNKLMNAQGLINQRNYVSGDATTTANQYTLDRWRVVTSTQNLTFSTTNNVTTFTAPAGGVEQVIEGVNIESGTYVLNWTGTATATVNSIARSKGETFSLTGGSNVTVRFNSGTFSLPQLEKGPTPSSFEYRPIGTELALCQRYFEKLAGPIQHNGTFENVILTWQFKERKRTLPACTNINGYTLFGFTVDNASWSSPGTVIIGDGSTADAEII